METKREQLKNRTDSELLAMVEEAKGHTGKGFQQHFKTNYSYTTLTDELVRRGYRYGWYLPDASSEKEPVAVEKEPGMDAVYVNCNDPRARFNLSMTQTAKETYEAFLNRQENARVGYIHTSAALLDYVRRYSSSSVCPTPLLPMPDEGERYVVYKEGFVKENASVLKEAAAVPSLKVNVSPQELCDTIKKHLVVED